MPFLFVFPNVLLTEFQDVLRCASNTHCLLMELCENDLFLFMKPAQINLLLKSSHSGFL